MKFHAAVYLWCSLNDKKEILNCNEPYDIMTSVLQLEYKAIFRFVNIKYIITSSFNNYQRASKCALAF